MPDLDAIAARHGVGPDAVRHLLDALARGHGRMAQFNHPDLGGMGQWSAGGMTMIGDMFNSGLKARVVALCDELAPLATAMPAEGGSVQSQGFSGHGFSGQGFGGSWWPEGLGQPATSGSQNDARYAFFPEARRLAIESGGRVTLYDTGDHRIGGVSQQQGSLHSLSFTSQFGPVRLDELPVVGEPGQDARPAPQAAPAPAPESFAASSSQSADAPSGDVFGMIERLSELHRRGALTEAEFAAKKTELLARL
ncbi:Short C-terminal domain-containing protein [Methylobacterium sp. 174MFSha1.1]|uniref:SHOCT domain-containing protein n=1 Tax=Methylobacterium sp. 174MFSha1.1 TaxID=1502749 RepID=UPI0008E2BE2A|nr:SHOCT domain-containing protein [Methylobacterium sp. 174MFSha1.1]SFV16340.1 Short C-terminal domain-containing protein [Methylobacterium sp. 174MFSha1.1]